MWKSAKLFSLVFIFMLVSCTTRALKCRTEDGPSEAELKRISRSCMRKISEGVSSSNVGARSRGYAFMPQNNRFGPTYLHQGNEGASDGLFGAQNDYNTYNYDEYNNNNNNRNNQRNNYGNRNEDILRQRNRDHDRDRQHERGRDRFQMSRSGSNSGSANNTGTSSNSGNSGGNGKNNNKSNSSSSNNNNNDNNNYDAACIVHCFFEEMNMLNNDDYPDKHKTQYMLTKDIRDRDLRNFYTDTIQECFRLLETQRRRNKCQFSRELVHCMLQYAHAHCDDWEDYNILFT